MYLKEILCINKATLPYPTFISRVIVILNWEKTVHLTSQKFVLSC